MESTFEENATKIEEACNLIVRDVCGELDQYVSACTQLLKDTTQEMTLSEMDSAIMNIPAMLYWVKAEKEKLGIRLDLANKVKDEKWNQCFLDAEGTATERKVYANSATAQESFDCIVYDRAYKMIDNREQMAFELMQSIKKVITRKLGGIQG